MTISKKQSFRVIFLLIVLTCAFFAHGCGRFGILLVPIHGDPKIEVLVETKPPGARIFIDGRDIGASPVSFTDESGIKKTYKIKISLQGYEKMTRLIERKWDTKRLVYRLDPIYFFSLNRSDPNERINQLFSERTDKTQDLSRLDIAASFQSENSLEGISTPITDFGNYFALIIGNNEYGSLPNLETAVNDGQAIAELLQRKYGYKVITLFNSTRVEIISALDRLRGTLTEKDNLLIYYAGHGILDKEVGRGYWLPVDALDNSTAQWISTTTVTDKIKALRAKHVLVVSDSCYSGTLVRDIRMTIKTGADRSYYNRLARKRARVALTSGGLEPVVDQGGEGHSVFAKAFISVLANNTQILEGQELFLKLKRTVILNADQTPEYGDIRLAGHEGGDFLFLPLNIGKHSNPN